MRTVRLFVYGTLKRGGERHECIRREIEGEFAQFLGSAEVEGFRLFRVGSYPVAVPGRGRVHGERYRIPRDLLIGEIDRIEGFPHGFDRKQIPIEDDSHWMYYRSEVPPGAEPIPSGTWPVDNDG